jgi:hypothetical protein
MLELLNVMGLIKITLIDLNPFFIVIYLRDTRVARHRSSWLWWEGAVCSNVRPHVDCATTILALVA